MSGPCRWGPREAGRVAEALLDDACRIYPPHDTVGEVKPSVIHHRGVARGSSVLQFGGAQVSRGSHGQQQRALYYRKENAVVD